MQSRLISLCLRSVSASVVFSLVFTLANPRLTLAAPGSVRIWTGAGFPHTNWANGLNWMGVVIPMTDDDIVFPSDAPGMTNFNNLPARTAFNSITLGGPGYFLFSGSPFIVSAGISSTNTTGANTIPGALIVNSNGCTISNAAGGALVLNGTIDLNGQELTIANAGSVFAFNSITNAGGLAKRGAGTLQLTRPNTYDGATRVLEGKVIALDDDALGSLADGTFVDAGAELQILNGRIIPEPLRLAGTLSSGLSTTNVWSGAITLLDSNVLIAVNSGGALRVTGSIDGPGGIRKTQGGDLTLIADNSYTGPTVIENGSLSINGAQPSSPVTVAPGGTLRGLNGHCGSVSNAPFGAIRPGDDAVLGALNVEGGLACMPFSLLEVRILDLISFDQINVIGPVDLGGATLQLQLLNAPPSVGASFLFISNDGTDAIVGSFAGMPEGAVFTVGTAGFQISYKGGDGNDAVISRVSEATTIQSIVCLTNRLKQIQGTGLPHSTYVLEATPNLDAPVLWMPIATNLANAAGVYEFIDEDSLLYSMRFYRVLSP
jgi:autotransporter-associated beta strand protein